jgi:hypothetical protein
MIMGKAIHYLSMLTSWPENFPSKFQDVVA